MTLRPEMLSAWWPHVPLGEAVEFLDHIRKPITASERNPGPYPYYGANGQQDSVADYLFDEPLVLLAEDGGYFDDPTRGVAYGVTGKCWVNNHAHVLRPRADFDFRFLKWHLAHYDVSAFVNGTTRAKLTKSAAERIPLIKPPLPEQRRIADILDKADAIRRKRKEAIALTEELLRSAFLEMFGDPVTNPKGWPVKPLAELTSLVSDGTHKTPTYRDSGIPFLSAKNIRAHRIDWVNTKFISRDEHQELIKRCLPERGDVLLTKSGTIGEAAVVERDVEFSLFESVALLKLKKDRLSPAIAAALLNNPSVRRLYGADIKGVAIKHLHLVDIRKLPTICPPKLLQHEYESFDRGIKETARHHERGVAEADTLFGALVAQAFSFQENARGQQC